MSRYLLLAALASSGSAFAQTSDEVRRESPIIVTGPGIDREADELIGKATALDRGDILERLNGSLGDTLDSQPGVASTFFGAGASRPVLRGLGADRVQVLTNGVGVIDVSAASPDHQVAADGIDADKIEILRGPAALAYGGQAIGGVVNVIDGQIAESSPERAASIDLFAAGNSVNDGTELAARGTFAAGPFVFNLSASQRDFDLYDIPGDAESSLLQAAEEAEGEEHDHDEEGASGVLENSFVETETLSGGVSYIGERGFVGVSVRQQTALYGLPGGHGHEEEEGEHDEDHGDEEEEEEAPFIDLEHTRIDLRAGLSLAETGFTDLAIALSHVDYTHTEFEAVGEPGTVFTTDGFEGRVDVTTAFGATDGAVGVQFYDTALDAIGDEAFISATDRSGFGAYVYQTREWDTGYGVEAGARIEDVELENVTGGSRNFNLLSGSFGAHRHMDNGIFFGAQVAYTERAPTQVELFADGPHLATQQFEIGNADLSVETGKNLEGTLRYTTDNGRIGINLFVASFDDFITLSAAGGEEDGLPIFTFVQSDADFVGGEVYGDYILPAGPLGADWTFDASLDFVSGELASGNNVPYLPPLTFNAGATAEWGGLSLGGQLTVAAEQDDQGVDELPTDGYTSLDLRASYDVSGLGVGREGTQVFVEARNVTDEEIRFATSVLKDIAPAPGQNIRFGLRAKF